MCRQGTIGSGRNDDGLMTEFWSKTNWFAVQAKPLRLDLAVSCLASLNFELFLPRVRRERAGGNAGWDSAPLFPGYFFARFCPLVSFDAVRYARGVLRIVGTTRAPVPVEPRIIDAIRERLHDDGLIHLERKPLREGELVVIEHGPLSGWMGKVEREWDEGRRVSILLNAIQQTRVLVERRWLGVTEAA